MSPLASVGFVFFFPYLFFSFFRDKNNEHEVYPLNKFLRVQYDIVDYMHSVVQQVSRTFYLA